MRDLKAIVFWRLVIFDQEHKYDKVGKNTKTVF